MDRNHFTDNANKLNISLPAHPFSIIYAANASLFICMVVNISICFLMKYAAKTEHYVIFGFRVNKKLAVLRPFDQT